MVSLIKVSRATFILCAGISLSSCNDPFHDADSNGSSNRSVNEQLEDLKILFDWNTQSDVAICSAIEANNNLISIGLPYTPKNNTRNQRQIDLFEDYLSSNFDEGITIVGREDRLAILNIELNNCDLLTDIRAHKSVKFVEPKYLSPISEDDIFESVVDLEAKAYQLNNMQVKENDEEERNPADYDPDSATETYDEYMYSISEKSSEIMDRHNITRIYNEFEHFGAPNIGVAVMDNGVVPEKLDYFGQGEGWYEATGFYKPFSVTDTAFDGPHPQPYDLYGITSLIDSIFEHGTRQTERAYYIAPHVNMMSVRASPFVVWLLATSFQGVTEAILSLAEDPDIRIISNSMGTFIHNHEIERAIDYFNAHDKLFISAAGTTVPILKDFVRIVFPANLESTISTTGIQDTQETGGEFILGETAHGGLENDFVVDHTQASSESVSTSAGMIALLWSANPSLSREQIIDILVRSSSFYQSHGSKDPVFGWGKIDMYQASLEVRKAK